MDKIIFLAIAGATIFILWFNLLADSPKLVSEEKPQVMSAVDESFAWEAYYGGGFGLDSVLDNSIRISTGADGGWYGAKASFEPKDLTSSTISFSVQAYNWEDVERVMVILASDSGLENYFSFNLKNYFAYPAAKEWINVSVEPSVFQLAEGSPDWTNINTVAVRVIPKTGVSTRVWFNDLTFHAKPAQAQAVVSLTFDDGFASVMEVAKVMDRYDYDGTAFIIPEFLGRENYLTQAEVDALAGMGWEIGGHGKDNLIGLLPSDADTQLAAIHLYLKERGYKGREHFAYPNGGYNLSVRSQVLEYFVSARTIDGFSQPTTKINSSYINAITISSSTPLVEVVEAVDQAVKDKSWLILVWHDFKESPLLDVEYRNDDFTFLLNYLNKNNIRVQLYGEAYDEMVNSEK